jgi:hypothetical protein
MTETRASRLVTFAAWGLIALGGVLRLRQYLANRSLWLDEAMLALNIVNRDFARLFKPLDYDQGAPLGFLLTEKLAATLLGSGELALRLLPLLAGCAALWLFYLLLKRMLAPAGMLTALALFALSPTLVYYSSEVKQYSSDVFIAIFLFWLFSRIFVPTPHTELLGTHGQTLHRRDAESAENLQKLSVLRVSAVKKFFRAPQLILALCGALAVWFSHPALFVLAAIGLVLLIENRKNPLPVLGMGALWLASFAALYFVSLRELSANAFMLDFWTEYFMPLSLATPLWILSALGGAFSNPAGLAADFWPIPAILALTGFIVLLRRHWQSAALCGLTLLAALAASALGKYPFGGRMILFSVPILFALVGAGVDGLVGWIKGKGRSGAAPLLAVLLAGIMLYAPFMTSAENFIQPKYAEHIRPTMAYLQSNRKPGDVLYVYYWAIPAFRYYAPRYGFVETDFMAGNQHQNDPSGLLAEIDQLKGHPRVWILFSHVYEKGDYNEKDAILQHLNQIGDKKREFREPGTSVSLFLYDLP